MKNLPTNSWTTDPANDFFESVTEEEVIDLWRTIKGKSLSEEDAWQAIVVGIALDMAFARTKTSFEIEH